MYCKLNSGDHSVRAKKNKSEIIHACRPGPQGWYLSACGLYFGPPEKVPKNTSITCRICQKALGFDAKEFTPARYLLKDISTNTFMKRDKGGISWVTEAYEATQWMTYDGAEHVRNYVIASRTASKFGLYNNSESLNFRRAVEKTLTVKKAFIRMEVED